jgi:hypothetical protein
MQGHSSMHRQQVAASVGRESVCRLSKEANSGSLIFVELKKNMDGRGGGDLLHEIECKLQQKASKS